jgi:ferric enterobactin receptor
MMLGNLNLNPVFIHSLEAGWMHTFDKGTLLSSIYYRNAHDVIQRLRTMDESGRVLLVAHNLAVQNSYGLEFNFNYIFSAWLKFNSGLNLFRQQVRGTFEGQNLHADAFTFTNRSALNATFAKSWRAQVSFNYRAPESKTQGKILSTYHMDVSLAREILKGNGNIVLNVRDVFNSRRFRSVTDTDLFYTETMFQWRPRSFQISFTYRFNQRPGQYEERNRPSYDEEG